MTDKDNRQTNIVTGIFSCILLGNTDIALSDAAQFFFVDWLGIPQAEAIIRIFLTLFVIIAISSLLLWMLLGTRMQKWFGYAWLPGTLIGIPIAVGISFLSGIVQRLNESQAWMEEELLFRICRMASAAVLPLCALTGWVFCQIKRRKQKTPKD